MITLIKKKDNELHLYKFTHSLQDLQFLLEKDYATHKPRQRDQKITPEKAEKLRNIFDNIITMLEDKQGYAQTEDQARSFILADYCSKFLRKNRNAETNRNKVLTLLGHLVHEGILKYDGIIQREPNGKLLKQYMLLASVEASRDKMNALLASASGKPRLTQPTNKQINTTSNIKSPLNDFEKASTVQEITASIEDVKIFLKSKETTPEGPLLKAQFQQVCTTKLRELLSEFNHSSTEKRQTIAKTILTKCKDLIPEIQHQQFLDICNNL